MAWKVADREITLVDLRACFTSAVVSDALDSVGCKNQSPRLQFRPLTSAGVLIGRCRTTLCEEARSRRDSLADWSHRSHAIDARARRIRPTHRSRTLRALLAPAQPELHVSHALPSPAMRSRLRTRPTMCLSVRARAVCSFQPEKAAEACRFRMRWSVLPPRWRSRLTNETESVQLAHAFDTAAC